MIQQQLDVPHVSLRGNPESGRVVGVDAGEKICCADDKYYAYSMRLSLQPHMAACKMISVEGQKGCDTPRGSVQSTTVFAEGQFFNLTF